MSHKKSFASPLKLPTLPIDRHLPKFIEALNHRPSLTLRAPTGAGKTTRVPLALLRAGLWDPEHPKILLIEPRQVAARAAARRMASELGERVGERVGYQVRFDRKVSAKTRIIVVTDGILMRILQRDPFLEGFGALIFDEFHERRLSTDLALALSRQIQLEARPDLRLLVMSATLDPTPVTKFLGNCTQLEVEGRTFPVEIEHLAHKDDRPAHLAAASGVERALHRWSGDILVFLPGVREIQRTQEALATSARAHDLLVLPLHGRLSPDEQDHALREGPQRRVILATNVAETSLTIPGITVVVDTGLAKSSQHDPNTGLNRLVLGQISKASAEQRAGRAGRTAPGNCLRLWTANTHQALPAQETAEIHRVDLSNAALELFSWGERSLKEFAWFEPPKEEALSSALALLQRLGALRKDNLTPLGQHMAALPIHPRLSRLLLEGQRLGDTRRVALAAAMLSEGDPFNAPRNATQATFIDSDLEERLQLLQRLRQKRGLPSGWRLRNHNGPRALQRSQQQLLRLLPKSPVSLDTDDMKKNHSMSQEEVLSRALIAAFPDRVALRRSPGERRALMVGGKGVKLHRNSAVMEPRLFICLDLDAGDRRNRAEALVRMAAGIPEEWLPKELLREGVQTQFDPDSEQVTAFENKHYLDLLLSKHPARLPDKSFIRHVLGAAAKMKLPYALALHRPEIVQWFARVELLIEHFPHLELPSFDEETLGALLPRLCGKCRSFAELQRLPLPQMLADTLTWKQREALDKETPTHLKVPSGDNIELTYSPDSPPVLPVKIQALFGLNKTPSILSGRVPVLLHLLAPNRRPQQVTQDLASFWKNTYPQLRKELRARYAKHPWPEDPLSAQPTRWTKRRPRKKK